MGCGSSTDTGRLGAATPAPEAKPRDENLLVSIQENVSLDDLPDCISDLHHGMPGTIKHAAMRLLKISAVLNWPTIKVFEEVNKSECFSVPYSEVSGDIWNQTAVLSWRWNKSKPASMQPGFTPMSPTQFRELVEVLQRAQAIGMQYVWIDWSCVPQYSTSPMVEVMRSKVFYARARTMIIVPTFNQLPGDGVVRLLLVKAARSLKRRGAQSSICELAASTVNTILERELVAGREYFSRVWTLAERMARYGRKEQLRNWLTLDAWLGMIVDAMITSTEDKSASRIYAKLLGREAAELLDRILEPLAAAVRTASMLVSEGLEDSVAQLFEMAATMWQSDSVLAEAPTKSWLMTYMEETHQGIYQAWNEGDRVWAVYSYFCWNQVDQSSQQGLLEALKNLAQVAGAGRKSLVALAGKLNLTALLQVDEADEKLLNAVEEGQLEQVQELLEAGANPLIKRPDGSTSVHLAAAKGHAGIIPLLAKAGVGVNTKREGGATPLTVAAMNGHTEAIRALLAAGADKELGFTDKATPLYIAAEKGHVEALRALMQAGAQADVVINTGYTPLLIASLHGFAEVVRILLQAGVKKDRTLQDGANALYLAAEKRHMDTVKELLKARVSTEACLQSGATPLYIASQNGDVEMVEVLLGGGANKNAARKDKSNPLYIASERGHLAVVKALLEREADVHHKFQSGATPLFIAAQNGHTETVLALLEAGADKNFKIEGGDSTPLLTAAKGGHVGVVDALLAKGANKDVQMKDGSTPLLVAASLGHLPVVQSLLGGQAKTELMKEGGVTPLIVATDNGHVDIVKALLGVGASISSARQSDGYSPLHIACSKGFVEIVRDVLDKGAEKDAALKDGTTPLHLAASNGFLEVAQVLVRAGARKTATNSLGQKPIDVAKAGTGIAELLSRD
ncbi:hypothetical protein Agub_g7260 [Astrephomene gubernaculifera]|uniref:Heterokaryon incompatibility domain-containing protein n=1 Tax=Astrephomene gubernaculifera TaxID=47775 RepID=A0AAD3DRE6_9CHLO|nr:hypothetical protein Agub_g7260 [Astrephomene gubernaculifera]